MNPVYLITGATGGIGQALSNELARTGVSLVLAAPNPRKLDQLADRLERDHQADLLTYPVDQGGATPEDYDQMAAAIGAECGRLDGVIHLAAHFRGLSPLLQAGGEEWARTFTINLHSVQWINQAVYPLLKNANGVIAAALDDTRTANAYWGAYGASKAGLAALMRITAEEAGGDGVRVIGWQPGPVRTTLHRLVHMEDGDARTPEDAAKELVKLLGVRGK